MSMEVDCLTQARAKCYRILALRSHSELELKRKLIRAGFKDGVIDEIIQELRHKGFLDDEAFAENLVRWRISSKSVGRGYLRQELIFKGIDGAIIEQVLKCYSYEQEFHSALTLARQKLKQGSGSNWRRVAALLSRRGFSAELVASVYRMLVKGD